MAEERKRMHLNSETALDLAEGKASESEQRFWDSHIESCHDCALDLRHWAILADWVRGAHLMDAPDESLVLARGIFTPTPKKSGLRIRQVIASLIFDSYAQPEFAGIRAGATAARETPRHIVWRAGEFDLHVTISTLEDHRDLLGQILPQGDGTFIQQARLHLRRGEERLGSTCVNEMGEFQFDDLPEGLLSLQIDLPHLTVISALAV